MPEMKTKLIKNCERCGAEFAAYRKEQRHCSRPCARAQEWLRRKARQPAKQAAREELLAAQAAFQEQLHQATLAMKAVLALHLTARPGQPPALPAVQELIAKLDAAGRAAE